MAHPFLLKFDRREGFCEHIASSFVILMRAMDIPARIVTGYQGGEFNAVGNYLIVRQSDAHAWTEVWIEDDAVAENEEAVTEPAFTEEAPAEADFIIEGAGGADAAVNQFKFVVVGGDVTDGDAGEGVFFCASADVDPDLVNLGDLFAVGVLHEVDRAFAGDALDGAVGGLNDYAAAGDNGAVVTADRIEVDKAVLVDVGEDEAEFVHVAGEHEDGTEPYDPDDAES